jgi:hypothetical protein
MRLSSALGEVSVAVRIRRFHDASFDAHLPMQMIPMHHDGGTRVRIQLTSLARLIVRVEHDESGLWSNVLAEDDAG